MLQVLIAISQSFVAEKRHGLYKSYSSKKELRKKWTKKCLRYLKQRVLRCPSKKRNEQDSTYP
jgi:hypothetical protein